MSLHTRPIQANGVGPVPREEYEAKWLPCSVCGGAKWERDIIDGYPVCPPHDHDLHGFPAFGISEHE